jgi:RanBP1 domain
LKDKKDDPFAALKGKPIKAEDSDEDSQNDVIDSVSGVALVPKQPPPPPVNHISGEEDETTLASKRCKLFAFDEETKGWKERGVQ